MATEAWRLRQTPALGGAQAAKLGDTQTNITTRLEELGKVEEIPDDARRPEARDKAWQALRTTVEEGRKELDAAYAGRSFGERRRATTAFWDNIGRFTQERFGAPLRKVAERRIPSPAETFAKMPMPLRAVGGALGAFAQAALFDMPQLTAAAMQHSPDPQQKTLGRKMMVVFDALEKHTPWYARAPAGFAGFAVSPYAKVGGLVAGGIRAAGAGPVPVRLGISAMRDVARQHGWRQVTRLAYQGFGSEATAWGSLFAARNVAETYARNPDASGDELMLAGTEGAAWGVMMQVLMPAVKITAARITASPRVLEALYRINPKFLSPRELDVKARAALESLTRQKFAHAGVEGKFSAEKAIKSLRVLLRDSQIRSEEPAVAAEFAKLGKKLDTAMKRTRAYAKAKGVDFNEAWVKLGYGKIPKAPAAAPTPPPEALEPLALAAKVPPATVTRAKAVVEQMAKLGRPVAQQRAAAAAVLQKAGAEPEAARTAAEKLVAAPEAPVAPPALEVAPGVAPAPPVAPEAAVGPPAVAERAAERRISPQQRKILERLASRFAISELTPEAREAVMSRAQDAGATVLALPESVVEEIATWPDHKQQRFRRATALRAEMSRQGLDAGKPQDREMVHAAAIARGQLGPPAALEALPAPAEAPHPAEKFVDDEIGALDFSAFGEIREPARVAAQNIRAIVTRFARLEAGTRQSLIRFEEEQKILPKRAAALAMRTLPPTVSKDAERAIQLHLDDPANNPLPEALMPAAERVRQFQEALFQRAKAEGIDIARWPEDRIAALQKQLATERKTTFVSKEAQANQVARIAALEATVEKLQGLGYAHRITEKGSLLTRGLRKVGRRIRGKRISKRPSRILGRKIATIEEAEEAGFEVARLREALGEYAHEITRTIQNKRLIDAIAANPELSLPKAEAPESWVSIDQTIYPSGINKRFAPVLAEAIEELTLSPPTHVLWRPYDRINSALKFIGFYNPLIMSKNDLFQGWRAGGLRFISKIPKAGKVWMDATTTEWQAAGKGRVLERIAPPDPKNVELYNHLRQSGLFNNVINYTPAARELVADIMAHVEKTMGRRVADQLVRHLNPLEIVRDVLKLNNLTTWNMDEVLRIACYLSLSEGTFTKPHLAGLIKPSPKPRLARIYEREPVIGAVAHAANFELAELANDFMANYGKVPRETRRWLNRVFFTPTYRVSMARMLGKMWAAPKKFWPQLLRHYAYKLFVAHVLGGLVAMYVYGKKWRDGRGEKGYRIVIDMGDGTQTAWSLSDPLLEEAKLTQRPALQSLFYNFAAIPHLVTSLYARKPPWQDEPMVHLFKIGAPFYRDLKNIMDEDKTTAEKILTELAIAYVYKRRTKPADEQTAAEALAKAVSIWTDWKMQRRDVARKLGFDVSPLAELDPAVAKVAVLEKKWEDANFRMRAIEKRWPVRERPAIAEKRYRKLRAERARYRDARVAMGKINIQWGFAKEQRAKAKPDHQKIVEYERKIIQVGQDFVRTHRKLQ